jgi:dolichol-phosphate mannosyltransferase
MAVLSAFLALFGGSFKEHLVSTFEVGQTLAALVAMTFNFVLNNALTYADQRLTGRGRCSRAGAFRADLLGRPARQRRRRRVLVRMGFHAYPARSPGS